MDTIEQIKRDIESLSSKERAEVSQRFFKTGPGQYGEGDIFIGLTVPDTRKIAKKYQNIELNEISQLLESKIHEYRLLALLILVEQFKISDEIQREKIHNFYLNNTKNINNWDLVDTSAPYIMGIYLHNKNKDILYKLAKSNDLWEKRISIISTFYFIRNKQFQDALKISEILMQDKHDLIHKAVGWMLREVGKKDQSVEENFLKKHYKTMPRTMLRYAIEKFDKSKKEFYMKR